MLLSKGANVNAEGRDGTTALHLASQIGQLKMINYQRSVKIHSNEIMEIMKMLLHKGANINAENTAGEIALRFAMSTGDTKVVELLLKHGAIVDATMKCDLITPLHIAAKYGHLDVIKLLLKFGAKVDSMIKHGVTTPLHNAAKSGRLKIAEFLLKLGASINSTDEYGRTALHSASEHGYNDIVMAFLEHGSDTTIMSKKTTQHLIALCILMVIGMVMIMFM